MIQIIILSIVVTITCFLVGGILGNFIFNKFKSIL